MYLLYLDESGNLHDPKDRHFVLAGLAVFERQTYYISRDMDDLQQAMLPHTEPIEFHATDIRSGKGFWRNVPEETRSLLISRLLNLFGRIPNRGVFLFAIAVEKGDGLYGEHVLRRAIMEICGRFDALLKRESEFEKPQLRTIR